MFRTDEVFTTCARGQKARIRPRDAHSRTCSYAVLIAGLRAPISLPQYVGLGADLTVLALVQPHSREMEYLLHGVARTTYENVKFGGPNVLCSFSRRRP